MVLTTLTRMARAGLTEEVLFGPDFKEDWEVRPASSSSRPVSSRCLYPCWAHRCVQGGEGAACAGAPLEGAMWNLEDPCAGWNQGDTLFSFFLLTLNCGLVRGDLEGKQNKND